MLEAVFIIAPPDPWTCVVVGPVEFACVVAPTDELELVVPPSVVDGYMVDEYGQLLTDLLGELLVHA